MQGRREKPHKAHPAETTGVLPCNPSAHFRLPLTVQPKKEKKTAGALQSGFLFTPRWTVAETTLLFFNLSKENTTPAQKAKGKQNIKPRKIARIFPKRPK